MSGIVQAFVLGWAGLMVGVSALMFIWHAGAGAISKSGL